MEKPAILGGKPTITKKLLIGPRIEDDDIEAVVEVLKSRLLSSLVGNVTKTFEKEFARKFRLKHVVAVANGSIALLIALKACGIGPGDEVIVPSFTFTSTVTSVIYANAIPVFADINYETYTIDPESVRRVITDKTKAIIAVHLFGHPAEMDELKEIADEHGLYLIEDSAQAIGAYYKGRPTGSLGDIAAFSLYATKNITSGEGGLVITDNDELAEKAKLIRSHGEEVRYFSKVLGFNFRMTEMQAALALSQLKKLDKFNEIRRRNAKIYTEHLAHRSELKLPVEKSYVKSSWSLYEVLLDLSKISINREFFIQALKAEGAPASVTYPRVIYEHPFIKELKGHGKGCPWTCPYYRGKNLSYEKVKTPIAEDVARRCISLYTDPLLAAEDIVEICAATEKILDYFSKK